MNKTLVDTNVILRYLLDDNEDQALLAEHLIDGGAWTTPEVLAEVTYVLEHYYGIERREIATALFQIAHKLDFEQPDVSFEAIKEYDATNLDFVDCMIVAYDKLNISKVFSFDKALNRRLTAI